MRPTPLAVTLAAAVAVLAVPSSASADVVRCKVGHYAPTLAHGKPEVSRLRAVDLPRQTDGYAPRCLVAEAVAAEVKRAIQDTGERPAQVRAGGARWNGGRWNCAYEGARTVCRHAGTPSRRVKFHLAG